MNIAIDSSRTTTARITGTEQYALQMIRALIRLNSTHDLHLYFRDAPAPDLFPPSEHVQHHVLPFPRLWTHLRFAAALWQDQPDITWVPAHTLPFVFPGRAAVTVHDLGYRHFPGAHPPRTRLYLDWTTRYSARRASIVFADSRATASDLTRFYETPPSKIRVVYPGVDVPPIGDTERVKHKYHLPERYLLFIGTLQPRKNIARLVRAHQHSGVDAALVLAGGQGWLFDPAWVGDAANVILTGYIDAADKGALYQGALALVFPSLYEGFGFPVLEAMGCGTPVICSNTSSLPELAGDAALLVDPLDVDGIAAAIRRVVDDDALRDTLRLRGYGQAARFTWEAAAQAVLDGLTQV